MSEKQIRQAEDYADRLKRERDEAVKREKALVEAQGKAAEDLSDLSRLLPDDSQALALCERALAALDQSGKGGTELMAELIEQINVYRDADGFAASWSAGGTWDHATPGEALAVVGEALDRGTDPVPADQSGKP